MNIREMEQFVYEYPKGERNAITDVPGVKVGHYTLDRESEKTGVTVILPCEGNVFLQKPVAASYALNGFGKTIGCLQLEELGVLESPIALTNTLSVGKVADALVTYTCRECEKDNIAVKSVNVVVGETNDSRINDIGRRLIGEEQVLSAIECAKEEFAQGNVGAGKGTVCFGLKGGIGSASRILTFCKKQYTLGVLVQSNFGATKDLLLHGQAIGKEIENQIKNKQENDKGSIMIVVGTNIPLSARQLKRVIKRAAVGLIRTGSHMGHGSGDVFLGFTNGNFCPDQKMEKLLTMQCFPENQMDKVFRLAAEATEEAIYHSMLYADAEQDLLGNIIYSLRDFL